MVSCAGRMQRPGRPALPTRRRCRETAHAPHRMQRSLRARQREVRRHKPTACNTSSLAHLTGTESLPTPCSNPADRADQPQLGHGRLQKPVAFVLHYLDRRWAAPAGAMLVLLPPAGQTLVDPGCFWSAAGHPGLTVRARAPPSPRTSFQHRYEHVCKRACRILQYVSGDQKLRRPDTIDVHSDY